jgi:hypothetical protein
MGRRVDGSIRASPSEIAVAPNLVADDRKFGAGALEGHAITQSTNDADEILIRDEIIGVAESRGGRCRKPELCAP